MILVLFKRAAAERKLHPLAPTPGPLLPALIDPGPDPAFTPAVLSCPLPQPPWPPASTSCQALPSPRRPISLRSDLFSPAALFVCSPDRQPCSLSLLQAFLCVHSNPPLSQPFSAPNPVDVIVSLIVHTDWNFGECTSNMPSLI